MPRIIAGRAKGRRFPAPPGERTRPTSDRVRESLFNAVVDWADTVDADPADALDGIAWLDLYSGSGAVAMEAASRGADPVVAVEADRRTARMIETSAQSLDLRLRVVTQRVETHVAAAPRPMDVVWADPPYDQPSDALDDILTSLTRGWLARTALVVLERDDRASAPQWPRGFTQTWERRYGGTVLYFGHWEETP